MQTSVYAECVPFCQRAHRFRRQFLGSDDACTLGILAAGQRLRTVRTPLGQAPPAENPLLGHGAALGPGAADPPECSIDQSTGRQQPAAAQPDPRLVILLLRLRLLLLRSPQWRRSHRVTLCPPSAPSNAQQRPLDTETAYIRPKPHHTTRRQRPGAQPHSHQGHALHSTSAADNIFA